MLLESTSRFLFALAVAVGITHGQSASRSAWRSRRSSRWWWCRSRSRARARRAASRARTLHDAPVLDAGRRARRTPRSRRPSPTCRSTTARGFAVAVLGIMLAEQTLMNAAVLIVNATSGEALAGFVFNVLLIVRAPLQLFQAIQTSILPHLAGLEARESGEEFARRSA